MGHGIKLTETEIRNNVLEKIKILDHEVELLGIRYKNNYIKASNAILTLKCKIHNVIDDNVKYYNFINWGWHCKICKEINNRSNKDEIELKIKEVIDESNKLGTDLEFVGFCDEDWKGYANGAKAIVKCNKHNTIITPYINNIILRDGGRNQDNKLRLFCPDCKKEYGNPEHRIPPEIAEQILKDKFPDSPYSFDKVKETYETLESDVTLICPTHGEFTRKYKYLVNSSNPRCPYCYEEHLLSRTKSDGSNSLVSMSDALEALKDIIADKNKNPDIDIEFLGFVDDKWIGIKTNLILRCRKHGVIWTETSFDTLRKPNTLYVCPICM